MESINQSKKLGRFCTHFFAFFSARCRKVSIFLRALETYNFYFHFTSIIVCQNGFWGLLLKNVFSAADVLKFLAKYWIMGAKLWLMLCLLWSWCFQLSIHESIAETFHDLLPKNFLAFRAWKENISSLHKHWWSRASAPEKKAINSCNREKWSAKIMHNSPVHFCSRHDRFARQCGVFEHFH